MHSMIRRTALLAQGVFHESGAKVRITEDGYTRVDPFSIAAKAGITVLLRPLDRLLGVFIRQSTSGILVNTERSAGLVHMTCAHELGHFYSGHQTTADETIDYGKSASIKEQEAEWFAYQLLAPRVVLANVLRRKGWTAQSLRNPIVLYQLSLRLGISYSATAWSLRRQDLLDMSSVHKLLEVQPADIKRSLIGEEPLGPRKEVWLLDESDQSSVLEPRPEDRLVLRLKGHASSGYVWSPKELAAEGFHIRPIENAPTPSTDLSDLVIGGSSTSDYLVSSEVGDASVSDHPVRLAFEERRPWSKAAAPGASYQATALFENIRPGLTDAAKRRLLQEALLA